MSKKFNKGDVVYLNYSTKATIPFLKGVYKIEACTNPSIDPVWKVSVLELPLNTLPKGYKIGDQIYFLESSLTLNAMTLNHFHPELLKITLDNLNKLEERIKNV